MATSAWETSIKLNLDEEWWRNLLWVTTILIGPNPWLCYKRGLSCLVILLEKLLAKQEAADWIPAPVFTLLGLKVGEKKLRSCRNKMAWWQHSQIVAKLTWLVLPGAIRGLNKYCMGIKLCFYLKPGQYMSNLGTKIRLRYKHCGLLLCNSKDRIKVCFISSWIMYHCV